MATLNEQQQLAVGCNNDKILCLAGAGTGKTFSMIARISRLVSEGVDPSSILVLTFTNAAAFEMKERYQKDHLKQRCPEFRTFHSFCYSLLATDKEVRNKLGYFAIPKIADHSQVKRIQTNAKMQCSIKLSDSKLLGRTPLAPGEDYQFNLYKKAVNKGLRSENLITFDKLCYGVCKLFVSDDPVVECYKQQYKYIFVDEFQDTDLKQYEFVESFTDAKLFVVGDALQAIYAFRGADSSIIKSLSTDPSWETIKLSQNYRSNKHICDYANEHSRHADDSYRVAIQSSKPGPHVDIIGVEGCDSFDEEVSTDTLEALPSIVTSCEGTTAILCRTNKEVDCVLETLDHLGIQYSTGKKNTDVIHIMKSVNNNQYMLDWLTTYLNAEKYAEYVRSTAIQAEEDPDSSPVRLFVEKYGTVRKIQEKLDMISQVRNILIAPKSRLEKVAEILELFDLGDKIAEFVDDEPQTIVELINRIIDMLNEDMENDLYVGTIHSSKGLEYDNVFLIGVGDKSFRLTNEENKNLYYVGITRAKDRLTIFECCDDCAPNWYEEELSS